MMLLQRVLLKVARHQKINSKLVPLFLNTSNATRNLNDVVKLIDKNNQEWVYHEKEEDPRFTGLDLVRKGASDEEEQDSCLFPLIRTLGVETEGKIHKFNSPCDRVIKFIKMGAINKMVATQYCHYLAHLTRSSTKKEEVEYFGKRCYDIMSYLLKQNKDVSSLVQTQLMCDVADTTPQYCTNICRYVLERPELLEKFPKRDLSKLIVSCYTHCLWNIASDMIRGTSDHKTVSYKLVDPLVDSIIKQASIYKETDNIEEKEVLREQVLEHLKVFIDSCAKHRVQFITKHPEDFLKALENLEMKLVKNPTIKMSGRCTNCENHLPIYESSMNYGLHHSIKGLLYARVAAASKLYLNTTPQDLANFEKYLEEIHNSDKRPIDCVIDGLNLAYRNSSGYNYIRQEYSDSTGTAVKTIRKHNPASQAQVLINTIIRGNMLEKFKKILVVGKAHMRNWPNLVKFFDQHRIYFYTSSNSAKDDLFQLYAATLNPKTVLITNDFFRDHLALLQGEDRIKLERWIDTHQAWIANKNLRPIWPTVFEKIPSLSQDKETFHIPVIDFNKFDTIAFHEPPPHLNSSMTKWICCSIKESGEKE